MKKFVFSHKKLFLFLFLAASVAWAVGTATFTSSVEFRSQSSSPVWEQIHTFVFDAGDGHAELSQTCDINGTLKRIWIDVGAATGIAGTVNVDFDDADGHEFDTNAGLTEGSTTKPASIDEPIDGMIIRVDPSDDPTDGSWTITVYLRGI